ncbi:carbohydrate esterase family 5 protein [Aulographum hederae CBS 113979]|uniref:cutinase n=1 Tax=Aulographum hederae CBS 113979 TaxID=1176131 RepID=A0A6G1GUP6_9PEZI|nr:carbohydrate esterase family 5 protein [Aulographum hederae CBS 113979]
MKFTATAILLAATTLAAPVPEAEPQAAAAASCKSVSVIFARGTGDGLAGMGMVVGPSFSRSLNQAFGGDVNVQALEYPANTGAGIATMGNSCGGPMADMGKQIKSRCPNTKVVFAGYSQGGMCGHNAANRMPAASALVTFGDPFHIMKPAGTIKYKSFCAAADGLCGNGLPGIGHVAYFTNGQTQQAAQWIKENV